MSERRQKSLHRAKLLAGAPRCIYCEQPATTIEHMPPVGMFRSRLRLSGMEYPSCEPCNVGTKAADVVACAMARIRATDIPDDWQTKELGRLIGSLDQLAPGLRDEMTRDGRAEQTWRWTPGGLLRPAVTVHADGPILKRHLTVFTAKLGMALYREHVGEPLPPGGGVFTKWFLNAGLNQEQAEAMISILPIGGSLRQGRQHSIEQFGYRYNCDDKHIVAALAGFHSNLHAFVLATSTPATYAFVRDRDSYVDYVGLSKLAARLGSETGNRPDRRAAR